MRKMGLLFFLIFISACTTKPDDNYFVFSSSDMNKCFSVRYNYTDTIYMVTRYPEINTFQAILKEDDKNLINRLIDEISFDKHDSVYIDQTLRDGWGYKFYNYKNGEASSIYIYTTNPPTDLHTIARQLESLVTHQNFDTISKKIELGNLNHILLPTPPPPIKIIE